MSIVPVHGPAMWGYATLAESDQIVVHVVTENMLEFKAKIASDLDTSEPRYTWNFGDGAQVVDGRYVTHTFQPGHFLVTMSVETTQGPVNDDVEITVNGSGPQAAEQEEEWEERQPSKAA